MPKTDAERQKTRRDKKKKGGLVYYGRWVKESWKKVLDKKIEELNFVNESKK